MDAKQKVSTEIQSLEQALQQLEKSLMQDKNEFTRDSVIKRFELCFELSWKLLKAFLHYLGQDCYSPRSCIRMAGQTKLIPDVKAWMAYQDKRNLSSHTYREETAEAIYEIADDFLQDARLMLKTVKNQF
jgi:nucleotidyltransferase substrate binding protein (TIGR01987 family)